MEFNFIEVLIFLIGIYLMFTVIKLEGRMKGIKYTLEQISKQVGIRGNPIDEDLQKMINDGNDIKAVKKARETMGLSLVEGKQYVDALKFEDR